MRKTEEKTVYPFLEKKPAADGNNSTDGEAYCLHGHRIAWHFSDKGRDGIAFTLAGYDTVTTRSRINSILHAMWPGFDPDGKISHLGCFKIDNETHIGSHGSEVTMRGDDVLYVLHPRDADKSNARGWLLKRKIGSLPYATRTS